MTATESRRLVLRVALKLLGLGAVAVFLAILFSSLLPGERRRESLPLQVESLPPDQPLRVDWQGRRFLILRRPAMLQGRLPGLAPALADPASRHSEQPRSMEGPLRADGGEFFVALDYDPDFGCPLEYVPPGPAPVTPWLGGFHAPCSDSWFDPAGRVYKNQRTTHNLRVPPWHLAGGRPVLDQ